MSTLQAAPFSLVALSGRCGTAVRRVLLMLFAALPAVITLRNGTDTGIYLHAALACMGAMLACCIAARRLPTERIRWYIVALAEAYSALAYLAPMLLCMHAISYSQRAWIGNVASATSLTLFTPALMGMRSRRGKVVRSLDTALIIVATCLLALALGSGPMAAQGATRIWTGICSYCVLSLLALCSCLTDAPPGLRRFSEILCAYLGCSFLISLLVNASLPHLHLPDALANSLIALPEILLIDWIFQNNVRPPRRLAFWQRNSVDSLQPGVLTLAGTGLALVAFRDHPAFAATAIAVLMLCYVSRTQTFYTRLLHEQVLLRRQADDYQRMATRDPLTGIGNRRWFELNLHRLSAPHSVGQATLLVIDSDYFKMVNDRHGHTAGDQTLCLVADVLERETTDLPDSFIARIGGDEFAAILPECSAERARTIAERIRCGVEELGRTRGFGLTVSIGGVSLPIGSSREVWLETADAALYRVKQRGRNALEVHDASLPAAH